LSNTIDALYQTFLQIRASSAWESTSNTMRKWIAATAPKPVMASIAVA
jgi:hypothetical protein